MVHCVHQASSLQDDFVIAPWYYTNYTILIICMCKVAFCYSCMAIDCKPWWAYHFIFFLFLIFESLHSGAYFYIVIFCKTTESRDGIWRSLNLKPPPPEVLSTNIFSNTGDNGQPLCGPTLTRKRLGLLRHYTQKLWEYRDWITYSHSWSTLQRTPWGTWS